MPDRIHGLTGPGICDGLLLETRLVEISVCLMNDGVATLNTVRDSFRDVPCALVLGGVPLGPMGFLALGGVPPS